MGAMEVNDVLHGLLLIMFKQFFIFVKDVCQLFWFYENICPGSLGVGCHVYGRLRQQRTAGPLV